MFLVKSDSVLCQTHSTSQQYGPKFKQFMNIKIFITSDKIKIK